MIKGEASMASSQKKRREVCFGNPAIGFIQVGWITTLEDVHNNNDLIDENENNAVDCESGGRIVAMVNVPPEQVPEGILNVARPYRPFIRHVRILITSPNTTAASSTNSEQNFSEEENEENYQKTFIILFLFLDSTYAKEFVQDLHDKPYTTLEPNVKCSTYLVSKLEGLSFLTGDNDLKNIEKNNHSNHNIDNGHISLSKNEKYDENDDKNCAVCLEPIKSQVHRNNTNLSMQQQQHGGDAIITTVCNHSFHVDCLLGWHDSPCPVCRYDGGFGKDESLLSKCHTCGITENNYICLICGVVSCAAPSDSFTNECNNNNSSSSINSTVAAPAASLNDNGTLCSNRKRHINYLDENDNSRLDDPDICLHETPFNNCSTISENGISSSSNGLHVNYNNNSVATSSHAHQHYRETLHAYALDTQTQHVWDFCGRGYVHRLLQNSNDGKLVEVHDPSNKTSNVRSSQPGYLSDAQELFMVHAKLEGFATQYYNLLKNQMKAQREYYEEILEQIRLQKNNKKQNKRFNSTTNLIIALKQEKHQLEQQCLSLRRKYKHISAEVIDLMSMNESLEVGKEQLKRQISDTQKDREDARNMLARRLPPLEEKVRTLMMQLELESSSSSSSVKQKNGMGK